MNTKHSISVIIPVYNASESIVSCLESVQHQTVLPYETIIIDDGSTDDSYNIIMNYIKNIEGDVAFKLLKQSNAGPASARNHGISVARGNLVAFLDSDDIWETDKIEQQLLFIDEYDIVGSGIREIKRDRCIKLRHLLFSNPLKTSSILLHKKVLIEQNLYFSENKKYSEDFMLWLQLACRGHSIKLLGQVTTFDYQRKLSFGSTGLSSKLWLMEKGELENFFELYNNKSINFGLWFASSLYSLIKYFRRIFIIKILRKG